MTKRGALFLSVGALLWSVTAAGADESAPIAAAVPDRQVEVSPELPVLAQEALLAILQDEALQGAEMSFMVYDVETDQVLASADPDRLINPASNAKLVTTAAALSILGPEYRWRTEYYVTGPVQNGVLDGDLVVKGYGDPTVVNERLARVANEIYLAGIRKIKGRVLVDDSFFDRDMEAKGWELEEAPDRAYAAPVSALSLNFNAIGINIVPGKKGTLATVELDPPVSTARVEGQVTTGRWVRYLRVGTAEDKPRGTTLVEVSGEVGYRDRARRIYRRVYDPPRYFGAALVSFLQRRGVWVRDRVVPKKLPPGARLVYVDQSPRLTKVISDLNHYSNNFIAETVVKTLGAETTKKPGTFADGLARVRRFLQQNVGFPAEGYVYGNGSGLNDVNRVTARQIVQLLDHMHESFELGTEFKSSLAVAGTQGTIRHRMKDGPAERRLRAKTGTLRGVSALSGYVVDPRNRVLAFSILVQGYASDVRVSQIWEIQNHIGEALASDGASWERPEAPETERNPAVAVLSSAEEAEPEKGGNP